MHDTNFSDKLRTLFAKEEIAVRIHELAVEIDAVYQNEPLVMVCVLKGGFMFFSDLVKAVSICPQIDFVRLASYGTESYGAKDVQLSKDLELEVAGKHVLIVEDIVDSGRSMHFLAEHLRLKGAKSLRIAALIDKHERREVEVKVDFIGFSVPAGFIVGYGLDYAEEYRSIPAICILDI